VAPRLLAGVRLSFGLLSVLPAGHAAVDRDTARTAVVAAPVVGVVLGGLAGGVLALATLTGLGPAPAAVLAVGTLALLTRGLHLDGLADTADGLGSGPDRARALDVMRASDVGPFGVVTLVLVLLAQVTALAQLAGLGLGVAVAGLLVAAVTGRAALAWACRRGVPPAREGGLGALVAGSVPAGVAVASSVAVVGAAGALGAVAAPGTAAPLRGALVGAAAALTGLVAALVLLAHLRRRLGGVTGDVLGAVVEVATTAVLLGAAALTAGTG
jgi:adenosylcobinamide-GDP ribazoletransferase